MKEKYFTIDSDSLIKDLEKQGRIKKIGTGSRFDDDCIGYGDIQGDNTYNWELVDEEQGDDGDEVHFYGLSNDFEIREEGRLLTLSKHIGQDIRGGYEDEVIYIKDGDDEDCIFYMMVLENMYSNSSEDK